MSIFYVVVYKLELVSRKEEINDYLKIFFTDSLTGKYSYIESNKFSIYKMSKINELYTRFYIEGIANIIKAKDEAEIIISSYKNASSSLVIKEVVDDNEDIYKISSHFNRDIFLTKYKGK